MKLIALTLKEEELKLLSTLIGKKFDYYIHDEFRLTNTTLKRIGFSIGGRLFVLKNDLEEFNDYFFDENEVPMLKFEPVENEEGLRDKATVIPPVKSVVSADINDILIVRDSIIASTEKEQEEVQSDEGIIIKTSLKDYGFFKQDPTIMEFIDIYTGHHVENNIEPLDKRWSFLVPGLVKKAKREFVSLKVK